MIERDVRDILNEIALTTARATIEAVEGGSLKREDQERILTEATVFGPGALSFSRQQVLRKVWDAFAANRIVEGIRERFTSDIETCAQILTAEKRDTSTIRGDLGLFLLAVVKEAADGLSVEFVPKMVNRLLFEYGGGELEWRGTIWLRGVRVEKSIEIREGMILRPPITEDFHSERPAAGFEILPPITVIPDAVLELACKACDRPDVSREINALSLFRLGAVEAIGEDLKSNSIFHYRGSNSMSLRVLSFASYTYDLRNEESSLKVFIEKIPSDFPVKAIGYHDDHKNPKWIALKNYFLALLTAYDVEERITQAVVSLESFLLSGEEKQELSFKLSLRTATLLRFAGFDPIAVFKDMGTAYKVRSKYSHGAAIKRALRDEALDLCPRVMNYARLVVVKFLEFPEPKSREEIRSQIDLSLLDDEERRKLGEILEGGLWTYVLPKAQPTPLGDTDLP